ncbi:MAG: hypothetical protein Kow002_00080 [Anaerolineales bacterium]
MARKSKRQMRTRKAVSSAEFNPDYSDIKKDLKTILILAGSFIAVLIVLSFILN